MRSCAVHHSSRAVISEWRISINTNLVEPNVRRFYEIFCALSDLTAAHTHTLVKSILACYSGTYTLIAASSPDILANALSLLHGYAEDDDDLFNTPHIFANDVMIRMPFILKDFVKRINTARSKVCGKCIFLLLLLHLLSVIRWRQCNSHCCLPHLLLFTCDSC